jgi:hypothetical protein
MITSDEQLQTALERIAWFHHQVVHLRRKETNPVHYRASERWRGFTWKQSNL